MMMMMIIIIIIIPTKKHQQQIRDRDMNHHHGVLRGLEDDIICASYLWVREWLCRPILDLQSRAQSGHWKFAFVAGIQAAKWRRSLADCAWWQRSSSSADDADCVSVRQRCLSRAVATSSVGGMSHHCKPAFTVSLKRLQGRPCLL